MQKWIVTCLLSNGQMPKTMGAFFNLDALIWRAPYIGLYVITLWSLYYVHSLHQLVILAILIIGLQ